MKITTVLFDLDGTLTDSGPGIMNSVKYALEKVGEPTPDVDELRKFIGPPLKGQFMEHCGIDEEKAAEMTDKYQRLMAEFENARKRNAKEQSHMYDVGAKEVLAKLLPVVDNFERGLDALSEEEKEGAFAQGFIKIYQQMITVLEEIGVKPMDAVGKEFNPDFHNAVMHEENEEMGENLVSEEFQKGYMYKDGVLRHSMVKVVNYSYFRYTNLTEYRRK